tara:strand:- start:4213 stop:4494 length:282 start_codon:yes stop_codon:yes gene_type:complete
MASSELYQGTVSLSCCRFGGDRDKVFTQTGGHEWSERSLDASSQSKRQQADDAVDYPQGTPCGDFPVKADKLSTKINSTNSATRAGASSEASK